MNENRISRSVYKDMDSIRINGPFDFTDERLDKMADEIISERKKAIVIDLQNASYLTSTGIASIVKIYKRASVAGVAVYVANATDDMSNLIRLARLDKYIGFL